MTEFAQKVIFKDIFGKDWENLPKVFRAHYANRAYSQDVYECSGKLRIRISPFMRLFSPILSIFGTLLPFQSEGAKCIVKFLSNPNDNSFSFHRIVEYENRRVEFKSRLVPICDNEVIEFTKIGIGWHCAFVWNGEHVELRHKSYCILLFGKIVKLPLEIFFGRGFAFEKAINDKTFAMHMEMRHSLFGLLYSYSGEFLMAEQGE